MMPYRWGLRLNRIADVMNERVSRRVRQHGLGIPAMRVLLWLLDEDNRRVGELAAEAKIDPSAMSHIMRRLTLKGFIQRERLKDDNRSVIVSLTPQGRKIAEELAPRFKFYDTTLVAGFTEAEKDMLQSFLDRMAENTRLFGDEDALPAAEAPPAAKI